MAPDPEPATNPGAIRGFCLPAVRSGGRIHLRPLAILSGAEAARAVEARTGLPLAGGPLAFAMAELAVRDGRGARRALATLPEVLAWAAEAGQGVEESVRGLLRRLSAPRAAFAGFPADRPVVMGILNATPDSFSDGGRFLDPQRAVEQGRRLLEAGAEILDIGGESTRPGAEPVAPEEEIRRILPLVRHFAGLGAAVSVDTRHAAVMEAALAAGARIINDISALGGEGSLDVARRTKAPVVLMHMQGEPRSMQRDPVYDDAPLDVYEWLEARVAACLDAGIAAADIAVDPGIGFGKTVAHNLGILRSTALFHGLGVPLLIGVSRKGFIGRLSRGEPAQERVAGSLAAGLEAVSQGAQILRVHDAAETFQALAVRRGLATGGTGDQPG
jgi:dihydropteroate synthase